MRSETLCVGNHQICIFPLTICCRTRAEEMELVAPSLAVAPKGLHYSLSAPTTQHSGTSSHRRPVLLRMHSSAKAPLRVCHLHSRRPNASCQVFQGFCKASTCGRRQLNAICHWYCSSRKFTCIQRRSLMTIHTLASRQSGMQAQMYV